MERSQQGSSHTVNLTVCRWSPARLERSDKKNGWELKRRTCNQLLHVHEKNHCKRTSFTCSNHCGLLTTISPPWKTTVLFWKNCWVIHHCIKFVFQLLNNIDVHDRRIRRDGEDANNTLVRFLSRVGGPKIITYTHLRTNNHSKQHSTSIYISIPPQTSHPFSPKTTLQKKTKCPTGIRPLPLHLPKA